MTKGKVLKSAKLLEIEKKILRQKKGKIYPGLVPWQSRGFEGKRQLCWQEIHLEIKLYLAL